MKTQIGVGVAVLSALAAEGKDFDRDELNAMLDKLAASPEPEVRRGPMAMCYAPVIPRPVGFEYICKKCGTHTVYPKNLRFIESTLAHYRDESASLKALGLDITLDESVLCQKCKSEEELGIPKGLGVPIAGTIVGQILKDEARAKELGLANGDRVKIIGPFPLGSAYYVLPKSKACWINAKYISESGEILGDGVNVRLGPSLDARVVCLVGKSGKPLKRLPAQPGDPAEWVRIEVQVEWFDKIADYGFPVLKSSLSDLAYGDGPSTNPDRIDKLAWVINGKRTIVEESDGELLKQFMKGEVYFRDGSDGESVSMKSQLPRLRELLGVEESGHR
ncbi:MAG: hypothetical protein IJG18_01480 [Kiritimatiellae bacterium]|nr:hypothetical protein [Kiritimatiellia bacterium]